MNLDQFRSDINRVFRHWRDIGELSSEEAVAQRADFIDGAQRNMHDTEMMAQCAAHLRGIVAWVEECEARDGPRSEAIRIRLREARQ